MQIEQHEKNRELVTSCQKTHRNIILRVLIIYCWVLVSWLVCLYCWVFNWSSSDFRLVLLVVVTELIYWYSSRWGLSITTLYNNHCSLRFMLVNILPTCGWKNMIVVFHNSVKSGALEGWTVPAPLVAPVVLH
jgi:hypothetical protein